MYLPEISSCRWFIYSFIQYHSGYQYVPQGDTCAPQRVNKWHILQKVSLYLTKPQHKCTWLKLVQERFHSTCPVLWICIYWGHLPTSTTDARSQVSGSIDTFMLLANAKAQTHEFGHTIYQHRGMSKEWPPIIMIITCKATSHAIKYILNKEFNTYIRFILTQMIWTSVI